MAEKTILIIDDSLVFRSMLQAMILEHQPRWRILQASSADEAQQVLSRETVDYATIDYHMPGTDGLNLLRSLKQSHPEMKFIFITANLQDDLHEQLEALHVNCVHKPITEEKINHAIGQL
jgi:CheY-like chemotaxis protein